MTTLFEVDTEGLREVIGGTEPWRHAIELVANVFDEYRGYSEGRVKPTFCSVTLTKEGRNPAVLTVTDNGAGFDEVSDVWTFFRTTAKRSTADVSGRFNAGEKQLLAVATEAEILTGRHTVTFKDGKRKHVAHKTAKHAGTKVTVLLRWNFADYETALLQLKSVLPPQGLEYVVNGERIALPKLRATTRVSLPTVLLANVDGTNALRNSWRKTTVDVFEADVTEPTLYELGVPVCKLEHEFPFSLNVNQKIPVPISRDVVSKTYIERLIGSVLQSTAMDGISLLTTEHADATFLKASFEYITDTDALEQVIGDVLPNAVQWSSNTAANTLAAMEGMDVLSRGKFGRKTVDRLKQNEIVPSAIERFGSRIDKMRDMQPEDLVRKTEAKCPKCKHSFIVETDAG